MLAWPVSKLTREWQRFAFLNSPSTNVYTETVSGHHNRDAITSETSHPPVEPSGVSYSSDAGIW